jgi:Fic family protein
MTMTPDHHPHPLPSRQSRGRLRALHDALTSGRIDRREFLARASALGVVAAAISTILQHTPAIAQAMPESMPGA